MKVIPSPENSSSEKLIKTINPNGDPLTVDILKSFPGCEHYNETQALEIIQTLEKLSVICYDIVIAKKIYNIDNQHVVYLNGNTNTKAA